MAADASKEKYNPRQVPGILAARYPAWNDKDEPQEYVPDHTDMDHPSVFWIMNGWNDFQYNQASGAGTCGVCYWLVPGAISTMSRSEKWEGYAGEQSGLERAAMTPLKSFVGNSCSSAMMSFHVVSKTSPCFGVVNVNPGCQHVPRWCRSIIHWRRTRRLPHLRRLRQARSSSRPKSDETQSMQSMESMAYGRTADGLLPGGRFSR